jgi:RNA-directed DNA polymerase
VSYHAEYSEVGQAHYTGKDVTAGRRPHRPLLPDTGGPEDQKPTVLRGRANTAHADKRHRFRELDRCVEAERLLACWQDLKKAAASGGDPGTADAYAVNLQGNIEALVQRLKTTRYRATLVRRCSMPKANGTERPLGIPALEDKLVQRAGAKL